MAMNCEFVLDKINIPDTRVILITFIEETFSVSINLKTDSIYMHDIKGSIFLLKDNKLEDVKDKLPEKVKIIIVKEKNTKPSVNQEQIENMIRDMDNFNFNSKNLGLDTGESLYIKTEKKEDKLISVQTQDNLLEIEAFSKLFGYLTTSNYSATQEFDLAMSKKPYSKFYYDSLKSIQQSKNFMTDITQKFKKLEEYCNNLEKNKLAAENNFKIKEEELKFLQKISPSSSSNSELNDLKKRYFDLSNNFELLQKEKVKLEKEKFNGFSSENIDGNKDGILKEVNYNLQRKIDEMTNKIRSEEYGRKNLISKYQDTFVADIFNDSYVPSQTTKENEYLADFYNFLIFQAKNSFACDLKVLNDFFSYNSAMIRMIYNSKSYQKDKNLQKIELSKLDSKESKLKCEVFSLFLQNIYNLMD